MRARKPFYEGSVRDQLRSGYGKSTFRNGFFQYEGEWLEGKMHGRGKLMFGDGGFFEGEFRYNEITGSGLRRWPNGSEYSGEFVMGELHGQVNCKFLQYDFLVTCGISTYDAKSTISAS